MVGAEDPGELDGTGGATKVCFSRGNSSVSGATCCPGARCSSFQVLGSRSLATRSGESSWGGETGLGAGPEEPRTQPQAAPTFLFPPQLCSQDRAQPNPGVSGSHFLLPKRPHSRQAADVFIGAISQSSGYWSNQLPFPPTCFRGMARGEGQPFAGIPSALHCKLWMHSLLQGMGGTQKL